MSTDIQKPKEDYQTPEPRSLAIYVAWALVVATALFVAVGLALQGISIGGAESGVSNGGGGAGDIFRYVCPLH